MKYKIGDLVTMTDPGSSGATKSTMGVIVSEPINTPSGFTVRIAIGDKVLPVYTWSLKFVKRPPDPIPVNTSA